MRFHSIRSGSIAGFTLMMLLPALAAAQPAAEAAPAVSIVRAPEGALQPALATGPDGAIHMIYAVGPLRATDVFYVRLDPGAESFTEPARVNDRPESVSAAGGVQPPSIAVGADGSLHFAWLARGVPQPGQRRAGLEFAYTRSLDGGATFEPARNLLTSTSGLDGGGAVTVSPDGAIYAVWHGGAGTHLESRRAVYLTRSDDGGATFPPEWAATDAPLGACMCCNLSAVAGPGGRIDILYRSAGANVDRDVTLLTSLDGGREFVSEILDPWRLDACPASTMGLAAAPGGVAAAWRTQTRLAFTSTGESPAAPILDLTAAGAHARVAVAPDGARLFVWSESRGVRWRRYDAAGRALGDPGSAEGLPRESFAAPAARPDGSFVIVY